MKNLKKKQQQNNKKTKNKQILILCLGLDYYMLYFPGY